MGLDGTIAVVCKITIMTMLGFCEFCQYALKGNIFCDIFVSTVVYIAATDTIN